MTPGLLSLLQSLAACLPGAAVALHAVPFGEPLGPWVRWLWTAAGVLLSLAWLIDTRRAAGPPLNTLNRRQQISMLLVALGMVVLGHRVYWPTRHHEQQGAELLRVTTRGPGGGFQSSYTTTADQLARDTEFKHANIGLAFLLFGSLIFSKALRDALGPQRKPLESNGGETNGGAQPQS